MMISVKRKLENEKHRQRMIENPTFEEKLRDQYNFKKSSELRKKSKLDSLLKKNEFFFDLKDYDRKDKIKEKMNKEFNFVNA